MVLHYLFADREADTRTGGLRLSMQPLEYFKYFVGITLVEAGAVVLHRYLVIYLSAFGGTCGKV